MSPLAEELRLMRSQLTIKANLMAFALAAFRGTGAFYQDGASAARPTAALG